MLNLQMKQTITKKLTTYYYRAWHLKAYLQSEPFIITFGFKRLSQKNIEQNFEQINSWIKELKQMPFDIEFTTINYRSLGEQLLPKKLEITQEKFLKYLGEKRVFQEHITIIEKSLKQFPLLKPLLLKQPKLIMEYATVWSQLLSVCDYFIVNPKPNLYIRELEIEGVDSKFIEQHKKVLSTLLEAILKPQSYNQEITKIANYGFEKKYGLKYDLPTIRFRILDESLYINGLDDLSLPLNLFKKLELAFKKVYITENKINGLTFPKIKESVVIFGLGYGVDILKEIEWLKNKKLYYWGDIDTHGFAILSQIRGYFPSIKSILMNHKTVIEFKHLAVKESKPFKGKLHNLNQEEEEVFEALKSNIYGDSLRIEQERIPHFNLYYLL
jgi:hypothetical protein